MKIKKNTDAPKMEKSVNRVGRPAGSRSYFFVKFAIILSLVLAAGIVAFVFYLKLSHPDIENKRMLIDEQLSYCQELVTMKYRYSDIVTIKKSVSISTSYAIVKYNGLIRIGIADMSMIDFDVYNHGKSVRITIPAPEILGNDIVSQSVFDEHRSIFVPLTLEEVLDEVDKSRQERLDEVLEQGTLIAEAAEYAKKIITLSMKSCGFEEIIVVGGEH